MLSVRPEDAWGRRSRRRLSLSIMQYTYVAPCGLMHFLATSDMKDLHLGFSLIFRGSGGDGLEWGGWTRSHSWLRGTGTCHFHESARWSFSTLRLTYIKGTRFCNPSAESRTHTHLYKKHIFMQIIFLFFFPLSLKGSFPIQQANVNYDSAVIWACESTNMRTF